MAALEAGERCGQWGAAGPERGPGPGPGSLGSLLSRLPLAPPRRRTASQGQGPPEPPLLRTSKRTIYTAGRPPWAVRRQRVGEDDGGHADHRGAGRALGRAAVHGFVLQGAGRGAAGVGGPQRLQLRPPGRLRLRAARQRPPQAEEGQERESARVRLHHAQPAPRVGGCARGTLTFGKTVYGANVIVFEGILAFANKELLKLLDMKVFVDTDSDIRLVRRLQRDIMERGRDIVGVIKQYHKFVKPAFEQYIEPSVQVADIVVPRGGENSVALDLIVQHVHSQLEKREITVRAALASAHQGQPLPATLSVLENTPQVRGMHTIIRNKDTTRDEFIFYSKRLMRLLIEHALSFLPLKSVTVETPQGTTYEGKRFHRQRITGVSILRAGETMEQALTAVCKDIRLGKILIQTNHDTGEPELHYLRLPKEISEDYVILMDSTVSTGAAAMMAVRVLLDHDVPEERIFLLSLLMAEMGVHSVAYAFPRVRIITTAVDKRINEEFHIIPGIGNFGDRYFGTDAPPACTDSEAMDC
ncbi:uridine-cytidine kinase-like 1 isoform X2 [Gallus gallus]|uniref:uridine-cytidine kinase-like 1 isoform X2 n=1 Tax=Gallus gallus TaxID=9031 RepID=UPI000D64067D|nr:uridine-cytidine kinase-like 1 isoform X2 [Gallus gallus]XP_040524237.1 uridine-cytidine kinase-like 1 isoform X2 [Gallus gallus]|eukprot:XP_025004923.1 uridine-cytidine kinase-like 1 isoform X2 [Gallus gallus]